MLNIFNTIIEINIKAAVVILLILMVRLFLKNAPKKFSYMLWTVAAFRLCVPSSFKTIFSVFNFGGKEKISEQIAHSVEKIPTYVPNVSFEAPIVNSSAVNTPAVNIHQTSGGEIANIVADKSIDWGVLLTQILLVLWVLGFAAMFIYGVITYVKTHRRMQSRILSRDNIYFSDKIDTPFSMGFVKPKIYLPFGLTDDEQECIIAHEKCHIKRFDHIVKLFSYLLLCVHWFNPLCWIAFNRMTYDMETSCDEMVFATDITEEKKKQYSHTLVSVGTKKRFPTPAPINFDGISNTKSRIKNILKLRKTKVWIRVICYILCAVVLFACAADVNDNASEGSEINLSVEKTPMPVLLMNPKDYKAEDCDVYSNKHSTGDVLVFVAAESVTNFKFIHLNFSDDGSIEREPNSVIYKQSRLTPDGKPLMIDTFIGTSTAFGIQFTDENGFIRMFQICRHGKDGDFYLSEANPFSISELIVDAINNEVKIKTEEGDNDYLTDIDLGSGEMEFSAYVFMDLDCDGTAEGILSVPNYSGFLILREYNGDVYGYFMASKCFVLKTDGTYLSQPKDDSKFIREMSFNGSTMIETNIAMAVERRNIDNELVCTYEISGESVDLVKVEIFFDEWNKRENVKFLSFSKKEENVSSNDDKNSDDESGAVHADTAFEIGIATDEMLTDDSNIYFVDESAAYNNYDIYIRPNCNLTDFKFLELDESETLKIGRTLYEIDNLSEEDTFIGSTYINDVTVNRGFGFVDQNGNQRYFVIKCDLSGIYEEPIYVIEITAPTEQSDPSVLQFKNHQGEVILDASDVISAVPSYHHIDNSENVGICVQLTFTEEGSIKFAEATKEAAKNGSAIDIYVNGELLSSPIIDSEYAETGIIGGEAIISGDFLDFEQAQQFSDHINSAAAGK